MPLIPAPRALRSLGHDGWLLFAARSARMFAYGSLAVVLVLYLQAAGMSEGRIGRLLTFTLLGDTAISLWLTTRADRWGRRRTLIVGRRVDGAGWNCVSRYWRFCRAVGCGHDRRDQPQRQRSRSVSLDRAGGAVADADRGRAHRSVCLVQPGRLGGDCARRAWPAAGCANWLKSTALTGAAVYRPVIIGYAVVGLVLGAMFCFLSPATEIVAADKISRRPTFFGLHRSRSLVLMLAALFALDAFGGGFILQSLIAAWFHARFDVDPALLGTIFLLRESAGGRVGPFGGCLGEAVWPVEHDGLHASAVERAV